MFATLKRYRHIAAAAPVMLALAATASAQAPYPNRNITLVLPFAAGSGTDTTTRLIGKELGVALGVSMVIDNKAGANGSIAAEEVARATPDGYTWLLVTTFFTASPALDPKLRWDPQRDFIPVGQICRAPNFFVVPVSLPVRNVAEYVALAKAKPGTLNYSHPGKGSTGHLGFELFKRLAGIDVTGVGYRATKVGEKLQLNLGYSHPIEIAPPSGISFELENPTRLAVVGIDKELVGEIAAKVRSTRKPEPYKGKGVRYAGEQIRRKAGKAGKIGGKK